MKLRNAANSAWITLFQLDGEWSLIPFENGTAAAPSIYFKDSGTDTGLFSGGTDQVNITTGGTERVEWGTSEVVFNDSGANYDFRIEGDTNANLFFVDASADAVGIGTTSPAGTLSVNNASANCVIEVTRGAAGAGYGYTIVGADGATTPALRFQTISNGVWGSEVARFDSSGRLLIGTSTSYNVGSTVGAVFQQVNTDSVVNASFSRYTNDTSGAILSLGKSRGTSAGSYTIVQNGDELGSIRFAAADGTDLVTQAAQITCAVDGTPGANDMPGRLVFSTTADGASSPTERFRINSGGTLYSANNNVHLGTETAVMSGGGRFTVHGDFFNSTAGAAFSTTNDSNGAIYMQFGNSVGTKIGSITRASSTSVAYNTTSDYRLKENVTTLQAATQLIKELNPVSYNFIGHAEEKSSGFIAHELQEVIPEAVTGEKDATYADGSPNYQGVDLSKLVPLLTAALQEAIAKIETLEAKVAALEAS
jgi:hypothetical protein